MVDYNLRDLEDPVLLTEDEDLEELLLVAYMDRDAELAEAAACSRCERLGRAIGRAVPSINPHTLESGPLACTA